MDNAVLEKPSCKEALSFAGAQWRIINPDMTQVNRVVTQHNVPEIVARLLCAKQLPEEEITAFLTPTLRDHFPDPFKLQDMKEATEFLAQTIQDGKKISILGDFDVDGATSSALLYRFLCCCNQDPDIYIPDRLKEGYGPNDNALKSLKDKGAECVILLDCGITAHSVIDYGRSINLDIIVVDHHEPEMTLPDANFIINPKREDDASGFDMLAAVGVTFLLCTALNKTLRDSEFYEAQNIKEPDLREFLDLVALGTVCDMVPLLGPNRLFVKHGFKRMEHTSNIGLKTLIDVAGLKGPITPYHAGFVLGPRINAVSRMARSDLGASLLAAADEEKAKEISWHLQDCNDQRKAVQAEMEREAIKQIETSGQQESPFLFASDKTWHPGLSGLVAGRLKEKYQKPACVVTYAKAETGEMIARGSGRSIPGVNIAEAIQAAREAGLLINGGGHAMAGGFSMHPEREEDFKTFMAEHVQSQLGSDTVTSETEIEGLLTVQGAHPDFVMRFHDLLNPFGQGFPEPLFLFKNIKIVSADVVGGAHIRCMIADIEGSKRIKAMAFRAIDTDLGNALLNSVDATLDLVGYLKLDTWNGQNRAELHIKDGRFT